MKISRNLSAFTVLPLALALQSAPVLAVDSLIEEVIVTAQKRAQSLQEVSIAIAAFGEEDLKGLGATNLEEITEFVSGAELFDERGAGQPTWVIRGVGLSDFNSNNTPTAAIYYDEFYLTSNVLGGIGLFDVGRVEVLKGPQGGLYGRNTSGGAVRVLSKRPEVGEALNGYVTGTTGRWNRSGIEAVVGGSFNEKTAFRLSAMSDQGGGWQNSLATPEDDEYGDRDFSALRAQVSVELTDTMDLWVKLEGGTDRSETTLGYSRALYDANTGDFCSQAYAGNHDEQGCVTLSNLTNAFVLTPGDLGLLPSGQTLDGRHVMSNPINALDNQWAGVNVQLNWDLTFATVTAIAGYLEYDNNQRYDFDGQPLALFEETGKAELSAWSQELRLTSNSQGPLHWLAGITYAEDEDKEFRIGDLSDNVLVFPTLSERGFVQQTSSWGVYGQLDYALSETVSLNSSLRYTEEKKDLKNAFFEDLSGGFFYIEGVNKSLELDDNWSGHVGVDWTPADDLLVYGRITRGFKSGGFFGGFAFTEAELEPYREETVVSFEVGVKSSLLNKTLQLNSALFFYDYSDVQGFTQTYSPVTQTTLTKLGNLGDAEHTGAEMDIIWFPEAVEGLSFQVATAWLKAEIVNSDTIGLDQAGEQFPIEGLARTFSPEFSSSVQARYEWNVSDLLAAVQFNYSWRDNLVDASSSFSDIELAAFDHSGYEVLNARLSLAAEDDSWSVALIGRNLLDEVYWARASGDDLGSYISTPAKPESWAIEVNYQW